MKTTSMEWLINAFMTLLTTIVLVIIMIVVREISIKEAFNKDFIVGVATIGMMGFLFMIAMSWTHSAKVSTWLEKASEAEQRIKHWNIQKIDALMTQKDALLLECDEMIQAHTKERSHAINQIKHLTGELPVLYLPETRYRLPSWVKNSGNGK